MKNSILLTLAFFYLLGILSQEQNRPKVGLVLVVVPKDLLI
jgi:hypothetical protein